MLGGRMFILAAGRTFRHTAGPSDICNLSPRPPADFVIVSALVLDTSDPVSAGAGALRMTNFGDILTRIL